MVCFLFRNLKGYRLLVVIAVALTFAQVGASLLVAFPLKFILDKLVDRKDPHFPLAGLVLGFFDRLAPSTGVHGHHSKIAVILFATTLLVVLGLLNAGLSYVQLYLAAFVGQNLSARLRRRLFDHLQHLSLSWHGQQKTGDLVQRLIANVADIEKLVTDGLVDLLASILTLAGMVIVMYLVNWQFTLLSILIVPALFVVVLVYTRSIKAATRRAAKAAGQVAEVAAEDIAAITEVKAFTLEEREARRFGKRVATQRAAGLRAGWLQAQFTPLVVILSTMGTAIVVGVGAYVIAGHSVTLWVLTLPGGSLTVGTLTVFLAYLNQLYQPMRNLSKLTNLATVAAAGAERIQEVLEQPREVEVLARPGAAPYHGATRLRGDIRYDHVSFGYLPAQPVLEDISLHIPAGRKVALVGLSGSGKTTLVQLMPRFYERWAGAIRIDGVDQRAYPLEVLRHNISLVLPESVLFEGTIRDNIAIGRPDASEAQIVDAAQKAHIHETILALPGGYDARVREQGKNLSSGQRQRLAIARAILRDTPILILDEPTASLDVEAEAEVMHALETLVQGRTVLTISHRLSTLGHVDEIIVLHQGRIVEHGTYEQLKHAGGVFAYLLAEQNRYNLERREDQGRRLLRHLQQALRPAPRPAHGAVLRASAPNGRRPPPSPAALNGRGPRRMQAAPVRALATMRVGARAGGGGGRDGGGGPDMAVQPAEAEGSDATFRVASRNRMPSPAERDWPAHSALIEPGPPAGARGRAGRRALLLGAALLLLLAGAGGYSVVSHTARPGLSSPTRRGSTPSASLLRTVAVGAAPVAVEMDKTTGRAFVVNQGGDSVSVLDTRTGALLRSVAVGRTPVAVAVDRHTRHVFVVNQGSNTLSVLDSKTGAPRRVVSVGRGPTAVLLSRNTGQGWVLNTAGNTISVLRTKTGAVQRTVPVGVHPSAAIDDALTHRLFVVNTASDTVSVLDARTGAVRRTVAVGQEPSAADVDETRNRVFVANRGSDTLSVLDATTGAVLRRVAVGRQPTAVAVDTTDGHVFVANRGSGTVSVLDATTGLVLDTVAVGQGPSALEVDPTGHRVFVANTESGTVSVLDLRTGALRRSVAVGKSPVDVVMDRVGDRAFVVNRDSNTVSVLDAGVGRTASGVGNRQNRQRRLRLPDRGIRHGPVSGVGHASSPTVILPSPLLLLSPTTLYFGKQGAGTTGGVQTIRAINLGARPLTVTGIDVAGSDAGDFAERDSCTGAPIAVYRGCTISIRFTPLGSGMRSATLVITDSVPGSPQSVRLSGHG